MRCLLTGVFAVFVVDVDGSSNESDTRCNRSHSSGIIIFPLSTIITSNIVIAVIIIVVVIFGVIFIITLIMFFFFLFPLSVLLFVCNDYYCL